MSHCFTQLHLQIVFAVKYRVALIDNSIKPDLYKYMAGVINNRSHTCLIINGMPDHVHILIRINPAESISSLIQAIKGSSSRWINGHHSSSKSFRWQEGYGVFSYSLSHIPAVTRYIENQEKHHQQLSFQDEYKTMLDKYKISLDAPDLFRPLL
ncbi:IS200/IS605 family transposase [Chitinophaga sp. G-6-1-13]|uniref:IS200/IS605 family transposase n=1 Tax=Chitinophaga fulva TaxID=2728842 RepID=A0A848GQ40_9BACT|nr:IS200/IS605 family transposase [Chitinophaga fulva]NML40735.1 IS200/IS605 family transposase [Chitinophaga fulva]